ncbi:nitrous oxide reductase accessory protein NosL [Natrinema salsiterrestre]|uniref:Nitrous oxide reductase accessory protein NosL n=1 Tax=Natrinema salsiterrestre TaxID=2950540 RepID=A0A9Q4PZN9_9EURY|nr:nitrous oxide reductase accessory protein NosL [Natrinema salsiterrestre]MDF9745170.1 nitrous oxide reductase accessory protein NosL [Natrinema salsiterrestre]
MTEREGLERRGLLGTLGAGIATGIAGCLGGTQPERDEDDTDDEPPAQVYEPSLEDVTEGPFEIPDGHRCAVCGMTANDYFGKGQLVHENGLAAVFDSPGCLFAYTVSSTPDSPVAGAWITDYGTGDLIDATGAHFVLITDEEAAEDPMGIDPRPYADREAAVSFLEEWAAEDLSPEEDIIIGLDEVDLELASIYRGTRLPDE